MVKKMEKIWFSFQIKTNYFGLIVLGFRRNGFGPVSWALFYFESGLFMVSGSSVQGTWLTLFGIRFTLRKWVRPIP